MQKSAREFLNCLDLNQTTIHTVDVNCKHLACTTQAYRQFADNAKGNKGDVVKLFF